MFSDPPPLSLYDFIVKASALSMLTTPSLNSSWMTTTPSPFVRQYSDVDINIISATGPSSTLSCIKSANTLGLGSISAALSAAEPSEDIGTFSIVNLGMYGTKTVAPVIIEPQSGILGVGATTVVVVPNPAYVKGADDGEEMYRYREVMTVTLSCDHRVVDGAVGAEWLQSFKGMMEKPERMML